MDKAAVAGLLRTALSGLEDDEEASTSASTSASTTSTEFRRPSTSRAREVASASVHDEVARTFSPYQSGTRKRPLTSPAVSQKWKLDKCHPFTHIFCCLRGRKDGKVPSPLDKGKLTSASLGMKRIHFPDKAGTAQEFEAHLLKHFPKLKEGGGFELLRSRGMTRSKDLEVIQCPDGGYTPLYLITEAGIGSATIYVRPLQANLSMDTTTSHASPGGPTIQCLYCNQLMKQSSIPAHVDVCSRQTSRSAMLGGGKDSMEAERREVQTVDIVGRQQARGNGAQSRREDDGGQCTAVEGKGKAEDQRDNTQNLGESSRRQHGQIPRDRNTNEGRQQASGNGAQSGREDDGGQRMDDNPGISAADQRDNTQNLGENSRRQHGQIPRDRNTNEEWKMEPDIEKAVHLYRHQLLRASGMEAELMVKLNMGQSPEVRERAILQFYKAPNVNWARDLTVILIGDAAVGDGVKRFFFTETMAKLQCGFELSLDGPGKTIFFTGDSDHLVPSTSKLLVDSDLYVVVGRMIGHCILHGGPALCGLSRSLLHPLIGQDGEEYLCIEDCPDMDVREIIQELDGDCDLNEDQKAKINDLCVSWDLPLLTSENRRWLAERVLVHAVLGRRERQIKQIRRGLKETQVLPLLRARPGALHVVFPEASSMCLVPEMILERIVWPSLSDSESDEEFELGQKCSVTGYLREYIQKATSNELCDLLKFWVGWAVLPQFLYVKVKSVRLPTAKTCFETLELPGDYTSFNKFKTDIQASVSTAYCGFGLV